MSSRQAQTVALCLATPPEVISLGPRVHGRGGSLERWRLPELHSLHLYTYRAEVDVDGVRHQIYPGSVSIVPPDAQMDFRFEGPSEHVFAHLRLPEAAPAEQLPVMQHLGIDSHPLQERLRAASFLTEAAPLAAELWSILWQLAGFARRHDGLSTVDHPSLLLAVGHVEAHLGEFLTVSEIAAAARMSPSHLNRLFRTSFGTSLIGYLRRRRMARAQHLLRDTTQTVASIAAAVGIPDLQAFNKACRREWGLSPRAIRLRKTSSQHFG